MKLIYANGVEVKVGDTVHLRASHLDCEIVEIVEPASPASTGRVYVSWDGSDTKHGYFPSVVGARWVGREDQE